MTSSLLLRPTSVWQASKGLYTAEEIVHQPQVWRALADIFATQPPQQTSSLIESWLANADHQVIFTGAGSSSYIAEVFASHLNQAWPAAVHAVPTTSLLTHPDDYFSDKTPTLLVSFSRSGDSPESLGAVHMLRSYGPTHRYLNITCNKEGGLAKLALNRTDNLNFLLPPASCDRGFAMTSSVTTMLLAALCLFQPDLTPEAVASTLSTLSTLVEAAITQWQQDLFDLAQSDIQRVVFLGSGPMLAVAKEGALKLLELTVGRVSVLAESPLGFRHGPKAFLNSKTLVIFLRGQNPLAQRYDDDLWQELKREQVAAQFYTVDPTTIDHAKTATLANYGDEWLAPLSLIALQQFALQKSINLNLTPDSPFPDGTLNRVVCGVTYYPR